MTNQNQSGTPQPNPQSDQTPGQQNQGGQQGGQTAPKPDQQQQK